MRILPQEIEYCSECHHAHDTHAISFNKRGPNCQAVKPAKSIPDYPRIPNWCPLPEKENK